MRDVAISGALAGVALSNKITLLGPMAVVVLVAIARRPIGIVSFAGRTVVAGAACLGAYAFIFLAAYEFHPMAAASALRHSLIFLHDAGAESGFWNGNFRLFLRAYNYEKLFAIWCLATLFLIFEIVRLKAWRSSIVLLANLVVAMFLCVGLYKRGAGTTFFEISSIFAGLTILMFAIALGLRRRGWWVWTVPTAIALGSLTQFDFSHNWSVVKQSRVLGKTAWEIREYTLAFRQPVVIVIPDISYYTGGTVEELLQTAFFSAQFDPADAKLTERFLFNTVFRREAGPICVGTTFVWFEKWNQSANEPLTETSIAEAKRWEALTRVGSVNDCRTWRLGYSGQSIVHVCSVKQLR